jgi:hypothetical protein
MWGTAAIFFTAATSAQEDDQQELPHDPALHRPVPEPRTNPNTLSSKFGVLPRSLDVEDN